MGAVGPKGVTSGDRRWRSPLVAGSVARREHGNAFGAQPISRPVDQDPILSAAFKSTVSNHAHLPNPPTA